MSSLDMGLPDMGLPDMSSPDMSSPDVGLTPKIDRLDGARVEARTH